MNRDTFRLVIECDLTGDGTVYLELDTCTSRSVSTDSTLTEYPIADGSIISDHMYRNPITFDVSGKFSSNGMNAAAKDDCFSADNLLKTPSKEKILNLKTAYGNTLSSEIETEIEDTFGIVENPYMNTYLETKNATTYNDSLKNITSSSDRLTRIEDVFEYIKNNGIVCTLTTIKGSPSDNSVSRFKTRENMVLKSIRWAESYNTVEYSFTFQEVMKANIQLYDAGTYEELYGATTTGSSIRSLGSVLADEDDDTIATLVIYALYDAGYIDKRDIGAFSWYGAYWSGIGVTTGYVLLALGCLGALFTVIILIGWGTIALAGTLAGVMLMSSAFTAIFPVGTVIAAIGLAAMGIYACYKAISSWWTTKKSVFGFLNDYKKICDSDGNLLIDESELADCEISEKYDNVLAVIDETRTEVQKIFEDVHVYSVSTDANDNDERVVPLVLNSSIIYVKFTWGEQSDGTYQWNIGVYDTSDCTNEITSRKHCIVTDLSECVQSNAFYLDKTQSPYTEVYIVNANLEDVVNNTQESQEVAEQYLVGYYIYVSFGCLETLYEEMQDSIVDIIEEVQDEES